MNKGVMVAVGLAASLALGTQVVAAQGVNADSLYKKHCKSCHGATGTPSARMVGMYPDLKALDATTLKGMTPEAVAGVLEKGKGKDMKSFTGKMSADEMKAVAEYVVKTFGGAGK